MKTNNPDHPPPRFRILNPVYYLDALLFWSVYTSTSILILWLLTSQAKDIVRTSTASHVISLTTTAAATLSLESRPHSSENLEVLNSVIEANPTFLAGAGVFRLTRENKIEPILVLDQGRSRQPDFKKPSHLFFIRQSLEQNRPTFSDWRFLHSRNLPALTRPAETFEYSFFHLPAFEEEGQPAFLAIAFHAPAIQERFLEVDRIGTFMVALSIVVATCLSIAVRFRSIQRVRANTERFAAVSLLERRGAILNAVARAADRLLSERRPELVLNDLLLEIRPQMHVRHLYASLVPTTPDSPVEIIGAGPKQAPIQLNHLESPPFHTWRDQLKQNQSVVIEAAHLETPLKAWADERKLGTLALFPVSRDGRLSGILAVEARPDQSPLDSTLLDVINVITDLFNASLTQREQNERIIRSSKIEALGRMAGGVAHEFNNLLHIISGNLRRLSRPDDEERHLVKRILEASDRGSAIVEQLLRATRQQRTNLAPVALNRIVEQTTELAARTLEKEATLRTNLDPTLPDVLADEGQIQQVILNLLLNARDAVAGKGTITITTSQAGDQVLCEVRDSGPGIPEDDLEHVFDPFFTTKAPGKGTGLGLSTCKGILEQHHGTIQVQNAPDGGACFIFSLPVPTTLPDQRPKGIEATQRIEPSKHDAVLIADDEALCRELVVDILTTEGFRVLEAINGEGAVELAHRHADEIGWVITDWTMPGLHGPPLLTQLKKELPKASLIVTSGYAVALENLPEVDRFIAKPFTPDQLLDLLMATPPRAGS